MGGVATGACERCLWLVSTLPEISLASVLGLAPLDTHVAGDEVLLLIDRRKAALLVGALADDRDSVGILGPDALGLGTALFCWGSERGRGGEEGTSCNVMGCDAKSKVSVYGNK